MEGIESNGGYRASVFGALFSLLFKLSFLPCQNMATSVYHFFQVYSVSLLIIILIKPECEVTHEE